MTLSVMISYPSEKLDEARSVYDYLQSLGLDVWFDRESLVAGDDWNHEIAEALRKAELIVLLSSNETVKKVGVVQRELNTILKRVEDFPVGHNYIVNIRTESVSLPSELSKYQWIDYFEADWKQRLLRAIFKRFKQLERQHPAELASAVAALNVATETQPRSIEISEINAKYSGSYFVYNETNDYMRYINAEIVSHVYRSLYSARSDFIGYEHDRPMEWSLQLEEFFRQGDLISLRFFWFQDAGGAHPSHGIGTINFAGQNHGKLSLDHLFWHNEDVAKYVLDFCQIDIDRQLRAVGRKLELDIRDWDRDTNIWNVIQEFSFNYKGITFNLSPYSVLPYVYGSYEVFMPWDYFKDKVNDHFEKSELANLIRG
jgi:hypothetical protein